MKRMKRIFKILLVASLLISCDSKPVKTWVEATNTVPSKCDTVYVDREIDSAEVAVGYLRTNGAFID